ncbi:MAG: tetratricopeptide repeat protein, partial [Pyrinomonadaceae bacterium]
MKVASSSLVTRSTFQMRENPITRRNLKYIAAGVIIVLSCGWSTNIPGQDHGQHSHSSETVKFPISCSEAAQVEFNQAVTLLHHMTYPEARRAFQKAALTDSGCAMANWGIAMTLFQPLWPTRPGPADLKYGWEILQKTRTLSSITEREKLFITTAETFFLEPSSTDYWLRIRRWEKAMADTYRLLPDDPEIAAFYALAHLAITPSDKITRANADRAAGILVGLYKKDPNHPGVMHYLVHANDVPGREHELLEITRRYESIAPQNPHALHMPTHIYTRLGDWTDVITGNLKAAEAALNYPVGEHGEFVWDEFPHAIEYLVYAYLQKGEDEAAKEQIKRLKGTKGLEPTFKTAFHLMSTQARYVLERHDWKEAAMLVAREPNTINWDRFTWPEAVAQFARGMGAIHLDKIADARSCATRLEQLEVATEKSGEVLFTRNIRLLRLELNAWIAHAGGQNDSSVALMKEAVDLEVSTPKPPVTPAPTIPANELLGDLFTARKLPREALAAYKRSLELYPKRFNSLIGAARAAGKLGDRPAAAAFYRRLLDVAGGGTRKEILKEA